ncbi:hypothetical protein OEA41_010352 [Lepraria neglecta]|uniref:Centromere protein H C-terminal domain-containing protein n=1 Tax=Lepraria neglecta TaxID=209136 RepID=A0AAD9YXM9_9LECA|nr:hypothetical protein OEA41_010352 [Lepraria neglecta]
MERLVVGLGATKISENAVMSSSTDAAFAEFAAHESGDTLPFYEIEGQVLALWDQLNELKLEQALLEAQNTLSGEEPDSYGETNAQLEEAERECLEARAAYMLRQSVVEGVLIADPILNAVHSGANATATERALHPLVDRRDALGIAHTNLSPNLESILKQTMEAEADSVRTMDENRALTATLLSLTRKIQAQRDKAISDARLSAQLDQVRADTAIARKRWRIMKSVVAAVVAGSGVDWARDKTLRELALDEDEVD